MAFLMLLAVLYVVAFVMLVTAALKCHEHALQSFVRGAADVEAGSAGGARYMLVENPSGKLLLALKA